MTHGGSSGDAKGEYAAMLLGATGNVGGHILHLLLQSPLCRKVVIVTGRNVAALGNPKVQQVVVNMDTLEQELAPHAKRVDIALAAFGVGKGSAKMADEEVRKIEITYEHEVGTELPRAPSRHAAAHPEGPRFVGGRKHDAAADRKRLAAQARVWKRDQARMGVRDSVADLGPADFKEMPSRRRGRGLALDHQDLQMRERLRRLPSTMYHDRIT